jgi:hypothetical protein
LTSKSINHSFEPAKKQKCQQNKFIYGMHPHLNPSSTFRLVGDTKKAFGRVGEETPPKGPDDSWKGIIGELGEKRPSAPGKTGVGNENKLNGIVGDTFDEDVGI